MVTSIFEFGSSITRTHDVAHARLISISNPLMLYGNSVSNNASNTSRLTSILRLALFASVVKKKLMIASFSLIGRLARLGRLIIIGIFRDNSASPFGPHDTTKNV